jgi:hypothetical protein
LGVGACGEVEDNEGGTGSGYLVLSLDLCKYLSPVKPMCLYQTFTHFK